MQYFIIGALGKYLISFVTKNICHHFWLKNRQITTIVSQLQAMPLAIQFKSLQPFYDHYNIEYLQSYYLVNVKIYKATNSYYFFDN